MLTIRKLLILLFLIHFSGYTQNFSKMKVDIDKQHFEVNYIYTTLANDKGKCFNPKGTNTFGLLPMTLTSKERWELRKEKKERIKSDRFKIEILTKYVRKNDWVVVVEHNLKDKDCKDGILRKRDLLWFSKDEELTNEIIDKKVKSTVTFMWWKNDRYIDYNIIWKHQPFSDETKNTSLINTIRNYIINSLPKAKRDKLYKKYGAACMCVRG